MIELGERDIFFAAVQMTRMSMCLCDARRPDAPLVFVNPAFVQMTGYAEAEAIGRNCRFMQGPQTDRAAIQALGAAIAKREAISIELFNYRRDGSGFWNALYVSPVFDTRGDLLYYFGSQLDVTRRREAETVLQQSQRVETLGTMASGIAHEFNNLMTVAISSLEQIGARMTDDWQRERLQRAEWATRRAGRLTQQILSFARRQFLDDQATDLGERVHELDGIVGQLIGPGVSLDFDLASEPVPVRIDAGQFELAVIHLVRNAADAMPDGGSLTVRTRRGIAADGGACAELAVRDTGSGMTPEVLRRAIEPFFTTKERGRGTGLGLSMVHGFAEQSGGRLLIDSAPGQGATLRLQLPLHGG